MPPAFPALVPDGLEPANHFHAAKSVLPFSVGDCWRWAASDLAGAAERRRHADLYDFALLHHTDKATLDPTNVDQWTFLVLGSAVLDAQVGAQRTITLAALERLRPITCRFDLLANTVWAAATEIGT